MYKNNKTNIVDFRGPRKKTKGWSPDKKFTEFGRIRVPKLLRAMKSVKNLAIVYNPETEVGYTYTDKQRKKLLKFIRQGWKELMHAWENSETIEERLKTGKKTKTNKKEFKESNWDWDVE